MVEKVAGIATDDGEVPATFLKFSEDPFERR